MWLWIPSTSSPSAPATAGSSSESTLPPTARLAASVTWSAKHRQPRFWSRKWKRDTWLALLSGTTCLRSTLWSGVESWISSLRASRASLQASPGSEKEQMTLAGFGPWSRVSSNEQPPPLSFSKTCQDCGRKGCKMCSKTLPRWGSMRSGVVSVQKRLAPRSVGTGYGCWPTVTASSYGNNRGGGAGRVGKVRPSQAGTVKRWATVTVHGNHNRKGLSPESGDGLATQVHRWATVKARYGSHPGGSPAELKRNSPDLPTQVMVWLRGPQGLELHPLNGQKVSLSPRFVERKQGLPLGWVSASATSATEWSLWLRRMRFALWYVEHSVSEA